MVSVAVYREGVLDFWKHWFNEYRVWELWIWYEYRVSTCCLFRHDIHTIFTIFTHDIHWISVFKITVNSDTNHLKFNSLKYLLACKWRYLSPRVLLYRNFLTMRLPVYQNAHDVNSHVCGGCSGRCLFYFQCSTVNIWTKGNIS